MRKTLNVALAVVLSLSMFATVAYVADPDRSSEYQLSLVSAKAVTVQDATQGVRSYSDIVDTTRGYQVNDPINLAITAEVKNLEKPASNNKLKSIAGKTIKVVVGSPSIDLSYARLQNPTLLSHVWSGYTGQDVATVGYTLAAGNVLDYDKATNEVSWKFKGVDMYAMPNTTQGGYSLVTFTPAIDDGKVLIPAIKLRDRDSKWSLGSYSYDITNEAPESVAYTMIIQGVTKDNAGAATGEFYAKIEIASAEKFEKYGTYYVDQAGNSASSVEALKLGTTGLTGKGIYEWLDYVKVDVKKLEVAGAYNVYRYNVPASAVMANIPIVYDGDYSDLQGKTLALVQPAKYDFDNKTAKNAGRVDSKNVAGGVRELSAYSNYTDGQKNATQLKYPLTSVIYSQNKAYYAPGYYGIAGTKAGTPVITSTEDVSGGKFVSTAGTTNLSVVDHFELTIPASALPSYSDNNIFVIKADQAAYSLDYKPAKTATAAADAIFTQANGPAALGAAANTTLDSSVLAAAYGAGADPYATLTMGNTLPANALTATGVSSKRLTGKPAGSSVAGEYTVSYVDLQNGDRTVTVKAADSTAQVYPLSTASNLKGNQWVVFYRDTNHQSALAVTYGNLNQRDHLLTAGIGVLNGDIAAGTTGRTYVTNGVLATAAAVAPAIPKTGVSQYNGALYAPTPSTLPGLSTLVSSTLDASNGALVTALAGATGTLAATDVFGASTPSAGAKVYQDQVDALNNVARSTVQYWPVFAEIAGTGSQATTVSGIEYGPVIKQIASSGATTGVVQYLDELQSASEVTDVAFYATTGASQTNTRAAGYSWTNAAYDSKGVIDYSALDTAAASRNGTTPSVSAIGNVVFTTITITTSSAGHKNIVLGGAYKCTAPSSATTVGSWTPLTDSDYKSIANSTVQIRFTLALGGQQTAYYDATNAAPLSIWDVSQNAESAWDIIDRDYHNSIVVYTITNNSTDRPWISMATEWTVYDSEDGYGLALFDDYNYNLTDSTKNYLAERVYRSNDTNLAYGNITTSGYVDDSASMISALKYFGLDTGLGTTFRVVNDAFESKGAAAVFSENVTGTFKYGNLTIISDEVQESTTEEEVTASEEPAEEEPAEEEPTEEEPTEEAPSESAAAPAVVRTGDASTNMAIALAAAAVVAAAGLAFVMKKVR